MRWSLLLASAVFTALFLAWQALAAMNFLYPLWHRVLHIDDTVRIYGPQNRNRHGFEDTTAEEHARLFAAIVEAVQHGGRGLEQLEYHDPQGHPIDRLLTAPEIVHLRDVARLVRLFHLFGWGSLLMLIGLALSLQWRPAPRPPARRYLAGIAVVTVSAAVGLSVLGPTTVFYTLHTWIFPANHPWFFYYQDSLMTTLMQAPVLFAGIGGEWLVLTLAILATLLAPAMRCPRMGAAARSVTSASPGR